MRTDEDLMSLVTRQVGGVSEAGHRQPWRLAIALLAQLAQDEMDGGIAPIGVGAVVRDGFLGGKAHGLIRDHVSIEGDESDFSLG
jgi:hypothetical protein